MISARAASPLSWGDLKDRITFLNEPSNGEFRAFPAACVDKIMHNNLPRLLQMCFAGCAETLKSRFLTSGSRTQGAETCCPTAVWENKPKRLLIILKSGRASVSPTAGPPPSCPWWAFTLFSAKILEIRNKTGPFFSSARAQNRDYWHRPLEGDHWRNQ